MIYETLKLCKSLVFETKHRAEQVVIQGIAKPLIAAIDSLKISA